MTFLYITYYERVFIQVGLLFYETLMQGARSSDACASTGTGALQPSY